MTDAGKPMTGSQTTLVDVIAVQIKEPHTARVIATGKTPANAEAFIKLAIMRRGVDVEFYTTRPAQEQNP